METGDPGTPGGAPEAEGATPGGSPAPERPQPFVGSPPPAQPPVAAAWPPPSAPPAYGQPPYGQPSYGQPPSGHPPYGQPPYGQPPYGQPPAGGSPYPGWNPAPPGQAGGAWPPPPPPAQAPGGWPAQAAGGYPPPPAGPPPGWSAPPPGPPPGWNPGGWNPAAATAWAPPPAGGPYPGWYAGPPGGGYAQAGSGGLRPHGIGELLDGAFTLYRRNFLLLVAIAAVVQVPFALVQLLLFEVSGVASRIGSLNDTLRTIGNQGNALTPDQSSQLLSDLGGTVAYYALVFIVQYLVVYPLSLAATTSAVSNRYLDQPATVGGSYRAAFARWRSITAMVLAVVLIVVGGMAVSILLAVVTGQIALFYLGFLVAIGVYVVVLVRTTVAPQAIVLEHLGGFPGLSRSWQLTRGAGGRVFGIRFLLGLIQAIAGYVIILPLDAAVAGTSTSTQLLIGQVGQAVTAVFIAPITLVTLTLLYYDLRIRREGFDIEMLAASL